MVCVWCVCGACVVRVWRVYVYVVYACVVVVEVHVGRAAGRSSRVLNSVTVDTASSRLQIESATYLKHEFMATAKNSAITVSGRVDHSMVSDQSSVTAIMSSSCSAPNPYLTGGERPCSGVRCEQSAARDVERVL